MPSNETSYTNHVDTTRRPEEADDEALAQELARQEQEQQDAALARRLQGVGSNSRATRRTTAHPAPVVVPHMCVVPCVFHTNSGGSLCVELMIDTGASTSVMSTAIMNRLGMWDKLDRSHQGMASGVGRARILGKLHQVPVELGHVEFPLDFIVLENQDMLLLLGLDLMRKYKCIVDLERSVLIFGGKGGAEVQMMPADEQQHAARSRLNGCPTM